MIPKFLSNVIVKFEVEIIVIKWEIICRNNKISICIKVIDSHK